MQTAMKRKLELTKGRLAVDAQRLEGMSPLKQLERGYAYVSDEQGHGITVIDQVAEGSLLRVAVTDCEIDAVVTGIRAMRRDWNGEGKIT